MFLNFIVKNAILFHNIVAATIDVVVALFSSKFDMHGGLWD